MQEIRAGTQLGRYRIEETLGRGGMSRVYLAENTRLGRRVALKVLAPELASDPVFRERFVRESQLATSLGHPNIVPVYDTDEANGLFYIAMQYVEGSDLSSYLNGHGRLSLEETVAILRQVAEALDAAHARELVHRDVKPGNILIAASDGPATPPRAYLADFGITKRATSESGLTTGGQFVGTIDYVAPEQIRGDPLDGRADVYSLGCVLYKCLTGSLPFVRDNDIAVLWAHLHDPPPSITAMVPSLPSALDDVLGRAMAKSPEDRFRTCTEFVDAVAAILSGAPDVVRESRIEGPFRVLLMGHSDDQPLIDTLAEELGGRGIRPWTHSDAGSTESVTTAAKTATAGFFCIGASGFGDLDREAVRAARDASTTRGAFSLVPVLLPGAPHVMDLSLVPSFLGAMPWVDMRDGIEAAMPALMNALSGVSSRDAAGELQGLCPYRGLQPFDEDHERFFFGRDADLQRLIEKLKASSFLAVVGPSGSGKSSLVRAGLVPALRRGAIPGSDSWDVHVLKPGPEPLSALAAHLLRMNAAFANEPIVDRMRNDERAFATALDVVGGDPETRVVWVVDQFEEAFTLCTDEDDRNAFISNLLYASSSGSKGIVILTLRADFYAQCAAHPGLAEVLGTSQYVVGPMGERALRAAIEQPARLVGLTFEQGLADTILSHAGAESGSLPLMEYALLEVWERTRDGRMTLEGYRDAGGVEGAIAKRAEGVFTSLRPAQQELARNVLLRLIQPGEGGDVTRRRADMSELLPDSEQARELEAVVDELVRARLLTVGESQGDGNSIEVAHEALLRVWPRLVAWIDEDRAGLRIHRRITDATLEWNRADRDDSLLFSGLRLAEAREWRMRKLGDLNQLERTFLDASEDRIEAARREEEDRRRRELEDAQRIARAQRRSARLSRGIAIVLVLGLAGSTTLALVARGQSRVARSRQLAIASTTVIDDNPELAALLAIESAKSAKTPQAESALHRALVAINEKAILPGHENLVVDEEFSPDGRHLLTRTGWALGISPEPAPAPAVVGLQGSKPAGQLDPLSNIYGIFREQDFGEHRVRYWDAKTGKLIWISPENAGKIRSARLSSDGTEVVGVSTDGTVCRWEATTGRQVSRSTIPTVRADDQLVVSPNGRVVAVIASKFDEAGTAVSSAARVWDVTSGRILVTWSDPKAVRMGGSFVFLTDSKAATTGAFGKDIAVWDVGSPKISSTLRGVGTDEGSATPWLKANASGSRLVTTAGEWDTRTGKQLADWSNAVLDPGDGISSMAVSSNGALVALGTTMGAVQIWKPGSKQPVASLRHTDSVYTVQFDRTSKRLLTTSADQTARIWSVDGKPIAVFHGHTDRVFSGAWNPAGTLVVTGGLDGTARVWDVTRANPPLTFRSRNEGEFVAFSAAGRFLALDTLRQKLSEFDGHRVVGNLVDGGTTIYSLAVNDQGTQIAGPALLPHPVKNGTVITDIVTILDIASGNKLRGFNPAEQDSRIEIEQGNPYAFSHDRRFLATSSAGGLAVWDLTTGRLIKLMAQDEPSIAMAFSPDGTRIASTEGTGTVREVLTGQVVFQLAGGHQLDAITWSANGSLIATGGSDKTVRLWNAQTGSQLFVLRGHDEPVGVGGASVSGRPVGSGGVSFSADGRWLASSSSDSVWIWDVTGTQVQVYHTDMFIDAAAFDRSGLNVGVGGRFPLFERATLSCHCEYSDFAPGTEIFRCELCVGIDRLLPIAQQRVTRTLTPEERRTFSL